MVCHHWQNDSEAVVYTGYCCRYEYTSTFWNLLAWRVLFIICFEHCAFLVSRLVCSLVPDTIQERKQREQYLVNKVLYEDDSGLNYRKGSRRSTTRMLEIPYTSSTQLQRVSRTRASGAGQDSEPSSGTEPALPDSTHSSDDNKSTLI